MIAANNSNINSISTILYDVGNKIVTYETIEVNHPIFNVDIASNTGSNTVMFSYYDGE
jgi:hypothetical protein